VVVVFDVKKSANSRYEAYTHNGTRATGRDPVELAAEMEKLGAGEIVLNSIDRDGRMQGYDLELIAQVRQRVSVPLTVLGGAGSLQDMQQVIARFGPIGVAAGSLFVFKGVYRAVLINYPDRTAKGATVHAR
jgi:cyclase